MAWWAHLKTYFLFLSIMIFLSISCWDGKNTQYFQEEEMKLFFIVLQSDRLSNLLVICVQMFFRVCNLNYIIIYIFDSQELVALFFLLQKCKRLDLWWLGCFKPSYVCRRKKQFGMIVFPLPLRMFSSVILWGIWLYNK